MRCAEVPVAVWWAVLGHKHVVLAGGCLASFLACGDGSSAGDGDAGDDTTDAAAPDAPLADAPPPDGPLADAAGGLPDLTLDLGRARIDLALREAEFAPDACELDPDEACIGGPGLRRLLHFSVETPNLGDGDMFLGVPDRSNPNFQFSACHMHFHFVGYAAYRLVDGEGGEVAVGRKQAFCLLDSERYATDDPSVAESPMYRCDNQGIQRGWSDVYDATLPCQYIDVTGVPDGPYTLEIELNSERRLAEKDYDNNLVSIQVDLAAPDLSSPTEPCPEGTDDRAARGTHRECGWTLADTFDCAPGQTVTFGCGSGPACGSTDCAGDPMIRVCDAERPDGNCSQPASLRSNDDAGGSLCPCASAVPCPASGRLAVYIGPSQYGQPFECAVQIETRM